MHELHAKLLDECHKRNIYPDGRPENVPDRGLMPPEKPKNRKNRIRAACIVIACAAILAGFIWYNVSVPKRGYYRYHDTTYYCSYQEERNGRGYHNGWEHWYAFDGTGWKISEQPAGKLITLLSYRGDRADSAWGSGEFILWTEHSYEDGYYLCDGAYWYYSTRTASLSSYYRNHWYRWYPNSSHPHWAQSSDFPRHDGEGYVIDPKAYYVGNERPPEWTCQDFGGRVGYYKDYNTLYYCTDKNVWYEYSEDYYRKSLSLKSYKIGKRWHSSSVLTPSGNMSYLGKIYRSEWGGCAYGTQEGYYNYNDELYYANGDTLFKQTQNGWVIASSPANNLNGYYVGSSYGSDWDGPEFEDIYLRLAETQYQTDQREAERERESRNQNDNNRYSNWSNNDYDDWDIGDTDWDSDW